MKRTLAFCTMIGALTLGCVVVWAINTCTTGCDAWNCSAGSVNNTGTLSKTAETICVGGTVTTPSISGTTFNNGSKSRTCTNSDCTTYTDGPHPITYSPVYSWEPDDPGQHAFNSCGPVTFTAKVKGVTGDTDCPADTATVTVGTFTVKVVAVASLTPDLPSGQGGLEPGSDPPTYWVCPCASGDVIVTASSCPSLTADQLPACWTFTGGVEIDKLHHKVSKASLLSGPVTFTVTAGTSTKTIILKQDEPTYYYKTQQPTATCPCHYGSGPDPDPTYDLCGNNVAVPCASPGWIYCNQYQFQYNGQVVGPCIYPHGQNVFLFRTTKHNCRILATWHLTREPASGSTPHMWTITKYDCLAGTSATICRTSPTWDENWARPADQVPPPVISAENAGTPCP